MIPEITLMKQKKVYKNLLTYANIFQGLVPLILVHSDNSEI